MESPKKQTRWALALSKVVLSNSFFYPFKGILYFYENPQFWAPLFLVCVPAAIVLIFVFFVLSIFVFPVYAFVVTSITGPLGIVSAVIALFLLCRQLTILILQFLFIRHIQGNIFMLVLKKEGAGKIVDRYLITPDRLMPRRTVGARLYYQALPAVSREILYVFLGIVPLIGPLVVLCARAPVKGYKAHKRYYKLMLWGYVEVNRFYREYQRDYLAFGIVALLMEMIPGLTIFAMFTNNIGMALWTAQYHKDFEAFMRETRENEAETSDEMDFWDTILETKKKTEALLADKKAKKI